MVDSVDSTEETLPESVRAAFDDMMKSVPGEPDAARSIAEIMFFAGAMYASTTITSSLKRGGPFLLMETIASVVRECMEYRETLVKEGEEQESTDSATEV